MVHLLLDLSRFVVCRRCKCCCAGIIAGQSKIVSYTFLEYRLHGMGCLTRLTFRCYFYRNCGTPSQC